MQRVDLRVMAVLVVEFSKEGYKIGMIDSRLKKSKSIGNWDVSWNGDEPTKIGPIFNKLFLLWIISNHSSHGNLRSDLVMIDTGQPVSITRVHKIQRLLAWTT